MAGTTQVTNPGGSSAAPSNNPGSFNAQLAAQNMANASNIYANMVTKTNTTSITQTSPQDIASAVNGVMQQLLGRNATANEIAQYGAELLAAEKANPGRFSETTTYGPTGKRADITGQQISSGVDPTAFLTTLIQGTAEARHYYAVNNYMSGLQELTNQFQGPL